jgi:hypothetical protein
MKYFLFVYFVFSAASAIQLDFPQRILITNKLTFDEEFQIHDIFARRREEVLHGFQLVFQEKERKLGLKSFFNNLSSEEPKIVSNEFLFLKHDIEKKIIMRTCSSIYPGKSNTMLPSDIFYIVWYFHFLKSNYFPLIFNFQC